MPDTIQLIIAALIIFAGSTVSSVVGFGLGLVSIPVLLLFLDAQAVVIMSNVMAAVLAALVAFQTREHVPYKRMVPIWAAGILGVPVGILVLRDVDPDTLGIFIAGLILAMTLVLTMGVKIPLPSIKYLGPVVGFVVAGLVATTGIGTPLLVLFLVRQDFAKQALRGSLKLFDMITITIALVGYGFAGLYTRERVILSLVALAPMALGFIFGSYIVRKMNEEIFRRGVILVTVITSITVLVREALS